MSATATFPHDHPRVIAVSAALNASTRKAFWPHGVSAEQLAAMERSAGLKPAAPAPANRSAKPVAPAAAKPAAAASPSPKPAEPQSYAMIFYDVAQPTGSPLARAAEGAVAQFNREFSK